MDYLALNESETFVAASVSKAIAPSWLAEMTLNKTARGVEVPTRLSSSNYS